MPLSHWLKICLSPSDWLICLRSESSESSSEQAQLDLGLARRSSQFLITPTENLDILRQPTTKSLEKDDNKILDINCLFRLISYSSTGSRSVLQTVFAWCKFHCTNAWVIEADFFVCSGFWTFGYTQRTVCLHLNLDCLSPPFTLRIRTIPSSARLFAALGKRTQDSEKVHVEKRGFFKAFLWTSTSAF
jgi:hypothetical protein